MSAPESPVLIVNRLQSATGEPITLNSTLAFADADDKAAFVAHLGLGGGGGGGGSGTVTSVAITVPTGLSVTGSPVTTSGTLAITTTLSGVLKGTGSGFAAAVAGTDYLAPNGSGVGLSGVVLTGGSYADPPWIASLAASKVSGTVTYANGLLQSGTGAFVGFNTPGELVFGEFITTVTFEAGQAELFRAGLGLGELASLTSANAITWTGLQTFGAGVLLDNCNLSLDGGDLEMTGGAINSSGAISFDGGSEGEAAAATRANLGITAFDPAEPGAIGGTTPAGGTFTELVSNTITKRTGDTVGIVGSVSALSVGGYFVTLTGSFNYITSDQLLTVPNFAVGPHVTFDTSLQGGYNSDATLELSSYGGSVGGAAIQLKQSTALKTPSTNTAVIGVKDVSGTAEVFVKDEAGNETQLSPHAQDAPSHLYDDDEVFPQVTREANYYLGVVRYCNHTRLRQNRPGYEHIETFAEHNARLSLTGEAALVALDWDEEQARQVAASVAAHDEWVARRVALLTAAPHVPLPDTPAPAVLEPKPKPAWLVAAQERAAAAAVVRPSRYVLAVKAEAQRRIIAATGGGAFWRERQVNMQATYTELALKAFSGEVLTQEEESTKAAIKVAWDKVKSIRAFSNWLETQPEATDIAAAQWPE